MNSRKDIFTAFQEGSERLSIQPSPQAWQHLEHRLDNPSKRNGRVVFMRWLTAAAAMLILVVGIYFVNRLSNGNDVALDHEPAPEFLEDLVNTVGCQPYCLLLEGRKDLPDYYANPIRK